MFFQDLYSESSGGAIVSTIVSNILVEKSSFQNCRAAQYQGALAIAESNSVLNKICGYQCKANNHDAFCSIAGGVGSRKKNFIFDSSISHCETKISYTMYHAYGFIHFKSVNLSHNKANQCAAIYSSPNINYGTEVSYCSFGNNTAENYCIIFKKDNCKHEVTHSNIIENKAINTMSSLGKTKLKITFIYYNSDPCFSIENSESSITLIQCYNNQLSGSGIFIESEQPNPFIVGMTFFETGKCKNLFINIPNQAKYRTKQQENIFLHKMTINYLFISLI